VKANKGYLSINTETNTLQFNGQQLSNNDGYVALDIRHIEETDRNLSHKRHLEKAFRDGMIKGLVWTQVTK